MSIQNRAKVAFSRSRPLGACEIFIFWLATLAFWDAVFSAPILSFANIHYLAFPATALTVIALVKRTAEAERSQIKRYMGKDLSTAVIPSVLFFTAITVATGIGGWALLVLIEASIAPERTFRAWDFITSDSFNGLKWSYSWVAIDLICASIVAPITEEIIFRGVIQRALLKQYSVPGAIFGTALIFSLFHFDKSFLSAFMHSIIFSVVAIRFSSLYAPMLVHGLYNFTTSILRASMGVSLVADPARFDTVSYWLPELTLLGVALLICAVYAIHSFSRQRQDASL
jgi:membrane protease YdiL (CAAX protease family)